MARVCSTLALSQSLNRAPNEPSEISVRHVSDMTDNQPAKENLGASGNTVSLSIDARSRPSERTSTRPTSVPGSTQRSQFGPLALSASEIAVTLPSESSPFPAMMTNILEPSTRFSRIPLSRYFTRAIGRSKKSSWSVLLLKRNVCSRKRLTGSTIQYSRGFLLPSSSRSSSPKPAKSDSIRRAMTSCDGLEKRNKPSGSAPHFRCTKPSSQSSPRLSKCRLG
jgi:hypothetical protein